MQSRFVHRTTWKLKSKNFIKFAKELVKIKSCSGKIKPDYLMLKIEHEGNIGSKAWLVEKVKELIALNAKRETRDARC